MKRIGLISLCVILLGGCAKSVEPLGELITEDRIVDGEFNSLYVDGTTNVFYTPADSVALKTHAYPGDHENILTEVQGTTLIIDDTAGVYPEMYREVLLRSLPPRRFLYSGSGEVELSGFPFENLSYQIGGTGEVVISGIANSYEGVFSGTGTLFMEGEGGVFSVNHQGIGTVDAQELIVESCKVEINGPGDAYVNVLSNMTVIFNGTGNVYYTGPVTQIIAIYNGSGELIRLPE